MSGFNLQELMSQAKQQYEVLQKKNAGDGGRGVLRAVEQSQ